MPIMDRDLGGKEGRISFLAPVETNGPCHPTGRPTITKDTLRVRQTGTKVWWRLGRQCLLVYSEAFLFGC